MATYSDAQLHELAKKRVDFRCHLFVYFVINAVLWGLWYFTGASYPWPIWATACWGIGLIFHYAFEYRSSRFLSEEEEFRKLKKDVGEQGASGV